MNRSMKRKAARPVGHVGTELENHFVLRLPPTQASQMREVLRSNQSSVIKDRLSIKLDYTQDKDDMRNGIITIDTIMHKSRLVDLPTIIESWKTIDNKNFYKTADICQMLMVKESDDPLEEEDSTKKKKKDHPNRVDKKYLWPHGYTPPLKNVRKRRFRKMLRKKNLELPEIEKEVKRLLRADEEALSVKWEVLREDEEKTGLGDPGQDGPGADGRTPANLDEQLFGEVLTSSDDDMGPPINIIDEDDDSRLSVDDTRFSEAYTQDISNSPHPGPSRLTAINTTTDGSPSPLPPTIATLLPPPSQPSTSHSLSKQQSGYVTEFNPSMFSSDGGSASGAPYSQSSELSIFGEGSSAMASGSGGLYDSPQLGVGGGGSSLFNVGGGLQGYDAPEDDHDDDGGLGQPAEDDSSSSSTLLTNMAPAGMDYAHDPRDKTALLRELGRVEGELSKLLVEQSSHQAHMDSLDNQALKSRFLGKLQDISSAIRDKEQQIAQLRNSLQR